MDACLFVGTSFSVGVTDLFVRGGLMTGRPMLAIDPGAASPPHSSVTLLREASEILLPAVCEMIGADPCEAARASG